MKRATILVTVLVAGMLLGGCVSRAVKEGIGAATGPKGGFREKRSPSASLRMYQKIEPGAFSDSFGGMTPGQLLAGLPGAITERLRKEGLPTAGAGNTLVVQGKIIYFEKAGAFGQVFGPFEEVIAEVQLVDKASRSVVATAICVGRSTTTTNQGVNKKTKGLAKGIVDWIAKRYPTAK